jgi:hypothetical protein
MRKLIPPPSAVPSLFPPPETSVLILIFAQKKWSIEIKYVEKGIVIEDVDRCTWTVAHGPCSLTSQ